MKRYRRLIILIAAFSAGYIIRGYYYPTWFEPAKVVETVTGYSAPANNEFITEITYQNGKFTPDTAVIRQGNYITITNTDENNLMWLESNYPKLRTVRGYAQSERIKARLDETGEFTVTDKLNLGARVTVTVTN